MIQDSFRGTVEQGCPLCRWFGHVKAFSTHWGAHKLIDRVVWHIKRLKVKNYVGMGRR